MYIVMYIVMTIYSDVPIMSPNVYQYNNIIIVIIIIICL